MKKKQVKIDRLIITSAKDIVSIFVDFLNRDWKKIDKTTYNLFAYYIKIVKKDKNVIIDLWEEDKLTGYVTPGKFSFFRFLSFIQIKLWIKSFTKKIKSTDENCEIIHTYTTIEGSSIFSSVNMLFKSTPILVLIIPIIIILLIILSKMK
jgi:hypothetical protein